MDSSNANETRKVIYTGLNKAFGWGERMKGERELRMIADLYNKEYELYYLNCSLCEKSTPMPFKNFLSRCPCCGNRLRREINIGGEE